MTLLTCRQPLLYLSGWDTFPFQCVATEHYSPLDLECWPFPLQGLLKPRSWAEKQSTLHQRKAWSETVCPGTLLMSSVFLELWPFPVATGILGEGAHPSVSRAELKGNLSQSAATTSEAQFTFANI